MTSSTVWAVISAAISRIVLAGPLQALFGMTSRSIVQRRPRRVPLALALVVMVSSGVTAFSLVSVKDEIQIGEAAQKEVRAKTPELTDKAVTSYIRSLGRRLVAHAEGPEYPYSFSVANYRDINAFALPGGPVWVNRGAIQAAQNEAQLAGVMGHEIAHVANRHSAEQLTKGMGAQLGLGVLGALLGGDRSLGAQAARLGAQIGASAGMMKFSRDHEREADEKGMTYMSRAGYDVRGMAEFMEILREQQGRDPSSVERFFASHPAPAERITRLEREAARLKQGGRRDSPDFQSVKRRLARLPPAKPMPKG
ncbi:MAG: M48 family metalloprotease [Luteitalea sp.]|nr:M48 family metalloprotease [Luteitalea sp.]